MSDSYEMDGPGFDLGDPPQLPRAHSAYRVLARKYRPQRFTELIGQDAMVQTLGNAIKRGRLAHAFIMTGVRGVGKTSTARLMAKALNCDTGPTIDPCGSCEACSAIAEGRHIDVIEMDAASNTGVDDVREIIEAVRYSAVSARYKVYIIDEVHMLSKNAFNALLKTLEEPPPHVKFIFATTEIQKVPITVLSRCQRFDLRRIPADLLVRHFKSVADNEGISIDPEALALIARAAEGSARDGLSILDQAIAHADMEGNGQVTGEQIRAMLGLSDRGATRTLFQLILDVDAPATLAALAEQQALGVDPLAIIRALLEICHGSTLAKVGTDPDPAYAQEEQAAYDDWGQRLSFAQLHRLWQLLLKGHEEVARAIDPAEAADMAILRIIHASSLPDPGELIKKLESGQMPLGNAIQSPMSPAPAVPTAKAPESFEALIALLSNKGHPLIAQQLHDYVGLVRYEAGALVLRPSKPLASDFAKDLTSAIKAITGQSWTISLSDETAQPSLREMELANEAAARDAILATPIIAAVKDAFPEAELIEEESRTG